MDTLNKISNCEVCGSTELKQVLDLGLHPMCDDLVPTGDPSKPPKFPISILYCNECNTAHQQFQIPKTKLFPKTYHYRSHLTADVLTGMNDLVKSVERKIGKLENLTVLDIGCNDGSLLDIFKQKGAKTIGVEPTGAHKDALGRGHEIINSFFDNKTANDIANNGSTIDIIVFTNVFAHIEDLRSLLKNLNKIMTDKTLLVIENHYLGSILRSNQFDTFYHEHPRTYSVKSFARIAKTLERELSAIEFPSRYGGNVRVFIKSNTMENTGEQELITELIKSEENFEKGFETMNNFIESWKQRKRKEIMELVKDKGRIVAKAFPGRAAILIELLGLTHNEIECIYEKPDSPKIGHYLPGTRIPIYSDEELMKRIDEVEKILNLAWHIPNEIRTYLKNSGFKGEVIDIVES